METQKTPHENGEDSLNSNSKDKEKPLRYSDMSIEQLDKEIKEEEEFYNGLSIFKYDLKNIENLKRDIERHNEGIAEKKRAYLESIKINKEYIKKDKGELKEVEQNIKERVDFKENGKRFVKLLKDIRKNLKENPNFYKVIK